jgi:hypothetical protein
MTKQQELETLRKAIQDLRVDSYLGPWLNSITDELERDLLSDFIPVLTLAEARERQDSILQSAQSIAAATVQKAKREADQIILAATKEAERIRSSIQNDLQKALSSIL